MTDDPSTNPIAPFLTEEQEPEVVQRVYDRLKTLLTRGEEVRYIAVQKPLNVADLTREILVLTNRRIMHYRPRVLGGGEFTDYIWRDIKRTELTEGTFRSTLLITAVNDDSIRFDDVPKEQARRVYAIGQEMEENVREELRIREMEEKRAAAGGIVLQNPTPSATTPEDPMQALSTLKQLADANLITMDEYEKKKNEILTRL